jgi:hypothetical protein
MGGCHIREGEEAALRGPAHWTQVALVPVLPLLVAAVPLARFANPSEAFCGVETWVLLWPVLPILPLHPPGSVLHGLKLCYKGHAPHNATASQPKIAAFRQRRRKRSAGKPPGERAHVLRNLVVTETLDSRRPLIPQARGLKSLPLVARLHLADPPLEPQGGRPHNLLRSARIGRILHFNCWTFGASKHRKQMLEPRQTR